MTDRTNGTDGMPAGTENDIDNDAEIDGSDDTDTGADTGLHGVAGALRGFAPQVRPPVLTTAGNGGDVGYVVEENVLGRMLFAARGDGTVLATAYVPGDAEEAAVLDRIAGTVSPRVLRDGGPTDAVRRQLDEYLARRRRAFEVRVDTALASDFQRQVLSRLATDVGYGRRVSYGQLAGALGRPSAARAVGAALGANPLCVVLPCHRVVAASGALTGYAGGLEAKRLLLELETAPPA